MQKTAIFPNESTEEFYFEMFWGQKGKGLN